tara:strand:- start:1574 stop:4261 length:2688 start_codon:yes stop_codon:yes gene_type:complete
MPKSLLSLLVLSLAAGGLFAADIELSPSGPISTPQAALDAARNAEKPVRIVVQEGVYFLSAPLELGPEDSQVTWEAAPGANPVFSGGRAITGWKDAGDGLWRAEVPGVKDGNWRFVQLWIGGRRATCARTPNRGFFHIADSCAPNVFPGVAKTEHRAFAAAPEEFAILEAIPENQRDDLLITVSHAWSVGQCRVEALDAATGSVLIRGGSRYGFLTRETNQRYWLENYRAALDAPGEWFLDRAAGEVLYRPLPGEDLNALEIVAPVAEQFAVIKGAENLVFRGITFRHGQYLYPQNGLQDGQAAVAVGGAIEIENSRGIRFENCEIGHIGRHAVYFKNGCSDSALVHCRLHDLGGGGVRIGETGRPERERLCRRIVVDDCIIQHGGRLHPSACGVTLTHAEDCAVTHCDIGDLYYTGVSFGWNWGYGESVSRRNRLENCHIHHLGWAYLSDMGGFYNLGNAPGTVIRGNHVHHVASYRYGGWGLYTDEGSGDVLMENNLVHDTSEAGFHQHYGYANRIRNNIFAFGEEAQVQRSQNEGRLNFVYENNIVVWDPESPLLDGGEGNWKFHETRERGEPKDSVIFRRNLYWPTDGKVPEYLTEKDFTWEEWRKMGRDAGSLFADPLFENLDARDFRLKPESPAAKIGFQSWDLESAGVRRDGPDGNAWRQLAASGHDYPTWEAEAKPWPAPPYQIELQTFERVGLGGLGIRGGKWTSHGKGETIGVTEEVSSPLPLAGQPGTVSKRSLEVRDAPGLERSYEPVLDVNPPWETGRITGRFDIMAREGADWFFEIRGKGGEFAAGPYLRWQNGKLGANNAYSTALADLPPGEWIRVEIAATTASGKWSVNLTREDGSTLEFPDLTCKPTWDNAGYLLWSAIGTTETSFFIDNLTLVREEE